MSAVSLGKNQFLEIGDVPIPAADVPSDSGVYSAICSSSGDPGRMWVTSQGKLWARSFGEAGYYSGTHVYIAD